MKLAVKYLLIVGFLVSSVAAHAVPLDSIPSPLKIPFTFSFQPDKLKCSEPFGFDWTYTTASLASMRGDTALFVYDGGGSTLQVSFDTLNRIIPVFNFYSLRAQNETTASYGSSWSIILYDLRFDGDSIFLNDSILENHLSSLAHTYQAMVNHGTTTRCDETSVNSLALGGIFIPIRLVSKTMDVNTEPANLLVVLLQNGRACKFLNPGILKLDCFNVIGRCVASIPVSPLESSVHLDGLTSGLYFLRLGSQIQKIYVPE